MTIQYPQFKAAACHASSVFLDAEKTAEKACDLIAEAARNGAALVVFPESFLPGFPVWAALQAPIYNHGFFRALVAEARPGDALYGLHAMVFDEPRVNDDQITLSAKAELAKVQEMINQGQWDQAHTQLAEVSTAVQSMNDNASRHDLMDQVNLLDTKVRSRDPNATLPPASGGPGVTAPVSQPPDVSMPPPPEQGSSPAPTPFPGGHRRHGQTAVPAPEAPDGAP